MCDFPRPGFPTAGYTQGIWHKHKQDLAQARCPGPGRPPPAQLPPARTGALPVTRRSPTGRWKRGWEREGERERERGREELSVPHSRRSGSGGHGGPRRGEGGKERECISASNRNLLPSALWMGGADHVCNEYNFFAECFLIGVGGMQDTRRIPPPFFKVLD